MKQIDSVFHHQQRDDETTEEYWDRVIDSSLAGWMKQLVNGDDSLVCLDDIRHERD